MPADRRRDSGLPAVRHDLGAMELAQIGNAADLGQAAAAADIGLHDPDLAARQPFQDFPAGRGGFRAADADGAALGQPRMAFEIVMLQGRLGEEDVAIADPVEHIERIVPVLPAIAEIDRHGDAVTQHLAAALDQIDQFAVGHQVVEQHFHLHRAEAALQRGIELPADLGHELFDGAAMREAGKDGAIGPQFVAPRAAQQLVGRNAVLLAGQVVERDVDGGDGVDAEPAPARPECPVIELLPQAGRFQRIGADQDLADIAAPQMRGRHFQERLDHVRRRVGLADAGKSGLIGQPDDDGVGRAVQVIGRRRWADDRNDLDGGNLVHGRVPDQ